MKNEFSPTWAKTTALGVFCSGRSQMAGSVFSFTTCVITDQKMRKKMNLKLSPDPG